MEPDGLDEFDFSQPLHYALSQLNGEPYPPLEQEPHFGNVHFPKPSSLSAMADEGDIDKPPPTTNEIIDELVENFDNYPKMVTTMMQRGLLKKRQQCRKCGRTMHLRRRKNCYEWRCRTKDKKGDCSSCSIKFGSWFEYTKLTFKTMFSFLIMHTKNCSTSHMVNELKLSTHTVLEVRKVIYELTDKIEGKYSRIGQNKANVYIEVMRLQSKKTNDFVYTVLAGQEVGSQKCFAIILPDSIPSTFERIKMKKVDPEARITMVKTVNEDSVFYANQSAAFFDESKFYNNQNEMFFTNLRRNHPENVFSSESCLQSWLNDQVVRKVEGRQMLERCVEELKTYTIS